MICLLKQNQCHIMMVCEDVLSGWANLIKGEKKKYSKMGFALLNNRLMHYPPIEDMFPLTALGWLIATVCLKGLWLADFKKMLASSLSEHPFRRGVKRSW